MKNLILLFFISLILVFTSCESTSERLERRDASRRYRVWQAKEQAYKDSVRNVHSDTLPTYVESEVIVNTTIKFKGATYYDVTYNNCDYVINSHNSQFMHKGNCRNPIHNQK